MRGRDRKYLVAVLHVPTVTGEPWWTPGKRSPTDDGLPATRLPGYRSATGVLQTPDLPKASVDGGSWSEVRRGALTSLAVAVARVPLLQPMKRCVTFPRPVPLGPAPRS